MEVIDYGKNIDINVKKLQHVHDVVSLVLGIALGILMLESLQGFLFYVVGLSLTNCVFYLVCCQGTPKTFFKNPIHDIFVSSILTNVSGFIMMWCLVYALVSSS
jgi:hypothetical protein